MKNSLKLYNDLELKAYLKKQSEKDLKFLKEIKERLIKSERDITQKEYVMKMIEDWIFELETNITLREG